jgi:hypothetical protein
MPLSFIELQSVASLSRRRHGFDSRTGRHLDCLLEISRVDSSSPTGRETKSPNRLEFDQGAPKGAGDLMFPLLLPDLRCPEGGLFNYRHLSPFEVLFHY